MIVFYFKLELNEGMKNERACGRRHGILLRLPSPRLVRDRQRRPFVPYRLELVAPDDRCLSDRAEDRRFSDVLRIVST